MLLERLIQVGEFTLHHLYAGYMERETHKSPNIRKTNKPLCSFWVPYISYSLFFSSWQLISPIGACAFSLSVINHIRLMYKSDKALFLQILPHIYQCALSAFFLTFFIIYNIWLFGHTILFRHFWTACMAHLPAAPSHLPTLDVLSKWLAGRGVDKGSGGKKRERWREAMWIIFIWLHGGTLWCILKLH